MRIVRKLKVGMLAVRHVKNWPTLMLDHLRLLPQREIRYSLRNGVVFWARGKTYDVNAIEETWILNVYTPPGFEISAGDTIIDIGANIGAFTVRAARHAATGRVFAVEPEKENVQRLSRNLAENGLTNVTVVEAAVGGTSGIRDFFVTPGNHSGHSLVDAGATAQTVKVEVISLDDFTARHDIDRIDLLKLDCEGAEFEIFASASDDVLRRIGKICMEVHPAESRDPAVLRRLLESKGFAVTVVGDQFYARR